jgi:benzoate membrane transport protein
LFLVTMVSQNLAGLAVLAAHGYRPRLRPVLASTGFVSAVVAPFGGHGINLAAVTAGLVAGPDAGPRPERRWLAGVAAGAAYLLFGLVAGLATALLSSAPSLLIEAVAGLALLPALGSALTAATRDERYRDVALVTFVVTASGITAVGLDSPFWGFVAGIGALAAFRSKPLRPAATLSPGRGAKTRRAEN